ncbi:T9SS type A sorting domain-containing protein [Flavobacterium sp.]|uniref:T9SS type A sorting domain-containing protein n=1 Tax=Flavobacterium sp. TaxID=239 RepID=UPI003D0B6A81
MKTKLLLFLLLLSLTITAQTNLVPNGNFETWSSSSQPDNWYRFLSGYVSQSTTAQNGKSSTNMMVATGTFNYINSEYFAVQANKTYRVTLYHRAVKGTFSSIDLSLYHKPGTFKEEIIKKSDVTFSTTEWRKIEFEYTSKVAENIEVDIWTNGSLNSEILIDNVSVVDVADVPVQYTLIPDANFEKLLITLGIDSGTIDGKVPTDKVNKLTTLNINNSNISDLTGIQDFVALTSLTIYLNKLTSVDVSKNTALKELDCRWNSIATLNLSNNLALTKLNCYANKLTSLDVSKNINLTSLDCSSNEITTLDLSKNTKLSTINCFFNLLTSLTIPTGNTLTNLSIGNNKLTTLDISTNTSLKSLEIRKNLLTSLDISNNVNLDHFVCSENLIKSLDASKNTKLTYFWCYYNSLLEEINLKNGNNTKININDLYLTDNGSLNCIVVDDVAYSNTNWSAKKDPYANFNATVCSTPQYTLIPDAGFEKTLIDLKIDGVEDGKVSTTRIANIKTLDLSKTNNTYKITDLTGIQDFAALEELQFPNNYNATIPTLDFSQNQSLKKLDCRQSGITSLNVSKNTALTELNCYGNKLTALDLSQNLALTKLDCSYNRLPTLNVSKNVNLINLSCSASNIEGVYSIQQGLLTSLDLSKNLALEFLDCSLNEKLVGLDVSKNTNLTSINVGYNKLKTIDFSANKLLKNISCPNNQLTSIDLSKYPVLESIDCSYNQLTVLDVSQKPALKILMCDYNQLTNLDVSKNIALEFLYCGNNKLTTLDLSTNPKLKQLLCGSNTNLTKLNLKNGGNTNFDPTYQSIFSNNPNLLCILVDDVDYANKKWAKYKDATASYNTECSFSLSSKNFTVASKGESCVGENNGEITITATAQFPYVASINGKSATFTNNNLKAANLAPGTYTIIVTIPGEVYEQTFNLSIAKATTVSGKSSITSKTVDVEITAGTAPFTVFVDGAEQFQTNDIAFSVDVNKTALVEVATAKACEGIFAKKVSVSDFESQLLAAYPNPTSASFEIEIPGVKNEVTIELYNFSGQLVSAKTYPVESGKAQLNLENQPSGIYAAKVYLNTPEYIKIIKK